ncbi:MAG TPA: T9SS type A sorting domain-containing protein, partial [Rhodothermales bacterium]|nr:T9SS type A sorting domain-containing protein [Rhodothermales bacterium]
ENKKFKEDFIQRMAAHLNTTFAPDHVLRTIDSIKNLLLPEIVRHKTRWERSLSFYKTWDDAIEVMRDFGRRRPDAIRTFYQSKFGLSGSAGLNLFVKSSTAETVGGTVTIQGVKMPDGNHRLLFFKNVPLRLKAIPDVGFTFVGWSGMVQTPSDTLTLTLVGESGLEARFERTSVANETEVLQQHLSLALYPNPSRETAQLRLSGLEPGLLKASVYDLLGREVHRIVQTENVSEVLVFALKPNALPAGLYLIRVSSNGTTRTIKWSIQR